MEYKEIGLLTRDRIPISDARVFWIGCFLFSALITGVLSVQEGEGERARFLALCGVLAASGFLLVPYAFYLCSETFVDWARSIDGFIKLADRDNMVEWHNTELRFFAGTRSMLVASLLFAGVATFAYADADFGRNVTRAGWIWMELMVFVSAFMAGCGLWAMYRAGVAIWRLGARFADKVTVTAGRFGVLSTGSMLAWCWGIIGIVWFMYSLSALLGPGNNELSKMLLSSPVLLIAGPTLPLICGTFIVCQFPLHKGMMAYKRREIRRVERWLDELLSEDKAALTKDKREEIEFLRQRWKELEGLPEWPFSRSAFAGMSGSTVLSVLPVLAKAVELSKPFAKAVTESQVWLR